MDFLAYNKPFIVFCAVPRPHLTYEPTPPFKMKVMIYVKQKFNEPSACL